MVEGGKGVEFALERMPKVSPNCQFPSRMDQCAWAISPPRASVTSNLKENGGQMDDSETALWGPVGVRCCGQDGRPGYQLDLSGSPPHHTLLRHPTSCASQQRSLLCLIYCESRWDLIWTNGVTAEMVRANGSRCSFTAKNYDTKNMLSFMMPDLFR